MSCEILLPFHGVAIIKVERCSVDANGTPLLAVLQKANSGEQSPAGDGHHNACCPCCQTQGMLLRSQDSHATSGCTVGA